MIPNANGKDNLDTEHDQNDVIDKYLTNIYYKPSGSASYYGKAKLWQYIKDREDKPVRLTLAKLTHWLNLQQTYEMHRSPVHKIRTERLIFDYLDQMWMTDIIVIGFPEANDGYKYLLIIQDCFSRFVWIKKLKTKTATKTAEAFKEVLDTGRHPEVLISDQGGEYLGKPFQDLLRDFKIVQQIALGKNKASIVERTNRTLENRLYKYFYEKQTHNFISVIDDLVKSYNSTVHSFIGMAPADVTPENSPDMYSRVYMPIVAKRSLHRPTPSFKRNDLVRLARADSVFARGFHVKFTEEIFRVINVILSHPVRYRVADLNNQEIRGSYYAEEMRKVPYKDPEEITYKIEKVLKTKTIRGKKFSLVSWLGYGKEFSTWIPSANISAYKGKI